MATNKRTQAPSARTETAYVRIYLESLQSPRHPGKRTPEWLQSQVALLPERIHEEMDPLKQLELRQRLLDCQADLLEQQGTNADEAEQGFVRVALPFSERKGITYAAWRAQGVPARVLKEAGMR